MTELKPCPFCGGSPRVIVRQQKYLGQYEDGRKELLLGFYVKCNRCHARGGLSCYYTDDREFPLGIGDAIENWNNRKGEENDA